MNVAVNWQPAEALGSHPEPRRNIHLHCFSLLPDALMQMEADVADVKEQLAQSLFDHIPVGVGSQGIIPTSAKDLEAALEMGMDWSLREVSGTSTADSPLGA